jgi:hypothetical protein
VFVGERVTATVVAAIEYSLKEGPVYAAGLDPASVTDVVKTPETAGEAAGDAGPVNIATPPITVLKPGGNTVGPEPVHWNALDDEAPTVVRKAPVHVASVVNDQPVGALTVTALIA